MVSVKEVIKEIAGGVPFRHNDLEVRRRGLGLSRVALGRIFGVDPATVFRRERGVLSGLWDYALRGVEAEACDKLSKGVLRSYKADLDRKLSLPEQYDEAHGQHSYLTEQMRKVAKEPPRTKRPQPRPPRANSPAPSGRSSELTRAQIKAAADRAEARSKRPSG